MSLLSVRDITAICTDGDSMLEAVLVLFGGLGVAYIGYRGGKYNADKNADSASEIKGVEVGADYIMWACDKLDSPDTKVAERGVEILRDLLGQFKADAQGRAVIKGALRAHTRQQIERNRGGSLPGGK